jgi:hypothetical protein
MTRHKAIIAADRAQRVAVGDRNRSRPGGQRPERGPAAKATNQALVAAGERAAREPAGSLGRRGWGVVAVACSTTGSIASARRVLEMVRDLEVRATARNLLDQLTKEDAHA